MATKQQIPSRKFLRWRTGRVHFNYLFFTFYFFVAAAIHVLHTFLVEAELPFPRVFFTSYALIQCALETGLLIVFGIILRQLLPRFLYLTFAAVLFVLLLSHVIDFPVIRLVDMSFWGALDFVLQQSYQNFMELLYAADVSLFVWAAAGLAALGVVLGGIWIFQRSERWTDRHPTPIRYSFLATILCTLVVALFSWEFLLGSLLNASQLEVYRKALPWKTLLRPPHQEHFQLSSTLKLPEEEQEALCCLDSRAFSLARKPDIYLFVVESLREDFITEQMAPHLHAFKSRNIHFDLALSNANATQISWFSLFFSKFPFYWGKINNENWKGGSIPLKMLKKMGYKIHVYSSARFGYYQMDQLIFGETQSLADTLFFPADDEFEEPYQKDQIVVAKLLEEMDNPQVSSGRVFLVFLDATHFNYSWPKDQANIFYPFEEKINYFKVALSTHNLDGIKNRYRNALGFVDSLIGQFLEKLDTAVGGKEAVVILTSDHGEEFYEHGHLFHKSGLTHQQTHVPLYYRFGSADWSQKKAPCAMTCHMDIFPSIFHYLIGEDIFGQILQGQSIFKQGRWPYVVAGRCNANRAPYEFFIHNGKQKVLARFSDEKDIFNARQLQILSSKNIDEENIPYTLTSLKEQFGEAFDHLCDP